MPDIRNVLRRKNAKIAGVAGGLADFFGLDVSLVRILFVASVLFGGSGLLIYLALWIVIPKEHDAYAMNVAPTVMV